MEFNKMKTEELIQIYLEITRFIDYLEKAKQIEQ